MSSQCRQLIIGFSAVLIAFAMMPLIGAAQIPFATSSAAQDVYANAESFAYPAYVFETTHVPIYLWKEVALRPKRSWMEPLEPRQLLSGSVGAGSFPRPVPHVMTLVAQLYEDSSRRVRPATAASAWTPVVIAPDQAPNAPSVPSIPLPAEPVRNAQFTVSDYRDVSTGFSIGTVNVTSLAATDSAPLNLPAQRISTADVVNSTDILEVWQTAGGQAKIRAVLSHAADIWTMSVTVESAPGWRINSVIINAPWVFAPNTATRQTYSAYRGGIVQDWPQEGYAHQNSSRWPGMGYSPIAVFYDAATTEGLGFTSFDGGLHQRDVFWVTGPTRVAPSVRWYVDIANGASATTTAELYHAFNMPTSHFTHYRDTFLQPFMADMGIAEAQMKVTGVWALDGDPNLNLVATAAHVVQLGATGYVQWAPPDMTFVEHGYFEPYAPSLPWYNQALEASKVAGLDSFGVLIDPWRASYAKGPTDGYPTVAEGLDWAGADEAQKKLWSQQSLTDPVVRAANDKLLASLKANGVSYAFWDTGGAPPSSQVIAWLDLLRQWAVSGVAIGAETSCDLAAYATGSIMSYRYFSDVDFALAKAVTPRATIFVMDDTLHVPEDDGQYWWDHIMNLGAVPILTYSRFARENNQLKLYAQEHPHH